MRRSLLLALAGLVLALVLTLDLAAAVGSGAALGFLVVAVLAWHF